MLEIYDFFNVYKTTIEHITYFSYVPLTFVYFLWNSSPQLFSSNYVNRETRKSANSPSLRIFNQLICRLFCVSGKAEIRLYQHKWRSKLFLIILKVIFSGNKTASLDCTIDYLIWRKKVISKINFQVLLNIKYY